MKAKNIVLVAAILILVCITAAGTYVSIQNYKKAGTNMTEQIDQNSENNASDSETEKSVTSQNQEIKEDSVSENKDIQKDEPNNEQEKKTPAFLYFVSQEDSDYEKAIKVFEELKKEYADKVDFQLKNVTEEPELLENFAFVEGNTPALITDGKELGIKLKTTDKNELKDEIEKMLK